MKQFLFLFLLYTATVTSLTKPASADALEDSCLVCGTETNIFSLCTKQGDHTLSCKQHCPELFHRNACCHCQGELQLTESLPKDFQKEIAAKARDVDLLALERKIEEERLNPIKSHHTALVDSIAHTFGCKVIQASNRKIIQKTQFAMAQRSAQHQAWSLIVSIISYHRAWQSMIRNPEDTDTHTKIEQVLKDLTNYTDQETIHLIGNDLGRFNFLHTNVLAALTQTEGHELDTIPDLKAIALQDMRVIETPL